MSGKISAKALCRAGVIAALYVVASLLLFPFTFGIFQFRLSEALTILPLFFAESVPALFVGCLITNIFGGGGLPDILIGSSATLVAACCTYLAGRLIKNKYGKFFVGIIFPILFNAFAVPLIFVINGTETYAYMIEVLIIGVEEAGSVAIFGGAVYFGGYRLLSPDGKRGRAKNAENAKNAKNAGNAENAENKEIKDKHEE